MDVDVEQILIVRAAQLRSVDVGQQLQTVTRSMIKCQCGKTTNLHGESYSHS